MYKLILQTFLIQSSLIDFSKKTKEKNLFYLLVRKNIGLIILIINKLKNPHENDNFLITL